MVTSPKRRFRSLSSHKSPELHIAIQMLLDGGLLFVEAYIYGTVLKITSNLSVVFSISGLRN